MLNDYELQREKHHLKTLVEYWSVLLSPNHTFPFRTLKYRLKPSQSDKASDRSQKFDCIYVVVR